LNDKSPGSQEEIEYLLCWRKGPVVLCLLKSGKDDRVENKMEPKEKPSKWDPLSCLPPLIIQELLRWNPKLRTEAPIRSLWKLNLTAPHQALKCFSTSLGRIFASWSILFRPQKGTPTMSEGHSTPPLSLVAQDGQSLCPFWEFYNLERQEL
jgi:hypothetical protein